MKRVTYLDISKLVEISLTFTFFSFEGEYYEQIYHVAMGSPLSSIISNLFMEDFESKGLASAPFKPNMWKRFIDDTFINWPHGHEKLDLFLQHLNNLSSSIKFTMEIKINDILPFLDVLISKRNDVSFSHQVFQKKTHMEQYLHASAHHFLAQKFGVLNTLAACAVRVSVKDHLEEEKTHLLKFFNHNGYSWSQGLRAFLKARKGPKLRKDQRELLTNIQLPFIQGNTDKIAQILRKHKISSTFRSMNSIYSFLKSAQDPVDPKNMKGVYLIPCSYGTPYIGEAYDFINQMIREHAIDIRNSRTHSSTL